MSNDTYIFTISDGDDYLAEIAISGSINLYGLAEHIIDTIGFDFDHAFGFYDNLINPYRSSEVYTLFNDMEDSEDDDPGVQKTFIQEVFEPKKKMIFLFDYGDDWQFLITCTAIQPRSDKKKIRQVLSTKGPQPEQYPEPDDD